MGFRSSVLVNRYAALVLPACCLHAYRPGFLAGWQVESSAFSAGDLPLERVRGELRLHFIYLDLSRNSVFGGVVNAKGALPQG